MYSITLSQRRTWWLVLNQVISLACRRSVCVYYAVLLLLLLLLFRRDALCGAHVTSIRSENEEQREWERERERDKDNSAIMRSWPPASEVIYRHDINCATSDCAARSCSDVSRAFLNRRERDTIGLALADIELLGLITNSYKTGPPYPFGRRFRVRWSGGGGGGGGAEGRSDDLGGRLPPDGPSDERYRRGAAWHRDSYSCSSSLTRRDVRLYAPKPSMSAEARRSWLADPPLPFVPSAATPFASTRHLLIWVSRRPQPTSLIIQRRIWCHSDRTLPPWRCSTERHHGSLVFYTPRPTREGSTAMAVQLRGALCRLLERGIDRGRRSIGSGGQSRWKDAIACRF